MDAADARGAMDAADALGAMDASDARGGGRRTVVAGVTAEASARAALLARDAAEAGADAVMVVAPPSWAGGVDPRAVLAHHRAIHDATARPLVLFQGVLGSGLHLAPAVLRELLRLPRVCAIKEGSWDEAAYARTRALVREARPDVAVLASGDEHLRPCFALGSEGSLVSLAAVVPELVVALEAAVRAGEDARADALDARLRPLAAAIYGAPPPGLAGVRLKACLHLLGRLPAPHARAPLPALEGAEREALRRALEAAGVAVPAAPSGMGASGASPGMAASARGAVPGATHGGTVPEATTPDAMTPDVAVPDATMPDVGMPGAAPSGPASGTSFGAPPDAPWLHVVRVDVDDAMRAEFDRWYDEEHVPALLACPGWLSARRYLCRDGGPRHAAVYEIAGPWAYHTPEFAAVRGFGALAPFVRGFRRQVLAPPGAAAGDVPPASEDASGADAPPA